MAAWFVWQMMQENEGVNIGMASRFWLPAYIIIMTYPLFSLVYFSRLKYILLLGLVFRRTSRIKIYWSFSKTTDHSHHFQFFLDVCYLFLQVNIWNCTAHGCQNKCLTVCLLLALCAFNSCCLFGNYSFQSSGSIARFSYSGILTEHFDPFPSNHSHLYLSFHASWYLRVFLVKAGVSDAVSISLWSDDCFPPKKECSEPCTCFRFDILWLIFYFTK